MSSVGAADWDAIALIGRSNVLSTALPRKRNLPHTCCMNFFVFASTGSAVDAVVAYYIVLVLLGTVTVACGLVRAGIASVPS